MADTVAAMQCHELSRNPQSDQGGGLVGLRHKLFGLVCAGLS